jgi:hypothetical protein
MGLVERNVVVCPDHPEAGILGIETATSLTPVTIYKTDDGIEIDVSSRSEFIRDMETSVTMGYKCAEETCTFMLLPADLEKYYAAT